ncbi:unnamed protein product [Urochloa humidicola]
MFRGPLVLSELFAQPAAFPAPLVADRTVGKHVRSLDSLYLRLLLDRVARSGRSDQSPNPDSPPTPPPCSSGDLHRSTLAAARQHRCVASVLLLLRFPAGDPPSSWKKEEQRLWCLLES